MTNKEAITHLKSIRNMALGEVMKEALTKAIEALEERPQGEITEEDIQNAIKAGYENGYSMAQAKYQRPHGECENCDYYKFSNAVCSGIVDEMVKLGIDNVDDLLKFLRGKEE